MKNYDNMFFKINELIIDCIQCIIIVFKFIFNKKNLIQNDFLVAPSQPCMMSKFDFAFALNLIHL